MHTTTNPLATLLFSALALLSGCASVYEVPSDGQPLADVSVDLNYSSRNFFEGFSVRGAVKCNPVPGARVLQPVIEAPGQRVAVASPGAQRHLTRLPANRPVPLRFTRSRGTDTDFWDFVVVLEAGHSYEARRDDQTGVRFVDLATQAEAQRLPHDWFHRALNCP